MSKFLKGMIILLVILAFAVGCSGVMKVFEEHEVGLELVVRAATGRILAEHPDWVEPAQRITSRALTVIDDDPEISLARLEEQVVRLIDWGKLTPEEQTLVRVLISKVREDLEEHFRKKGLSDPGAAAVRAAQVLTWINQSAALRMSSASLELREVPDIAAQLLACSVGLPILPCAGCGRA